MLFLKHAWPANSFGEIYSRQTANIEVPPSRGGGAHAAPCKYRVEGAENPSVGGGGGDTMSHPLIKI